MNDQPGQPNTPQLPQGYLPVAQLGAQVSLVRRVSDGQLLALKRCPEDDPHCEARLRQEAELLARLDHPNILSLLDARDGRNGRDGLQPSRARPQLLTPYIAGATLAQRYGSQPAVLPYPQLSALLAPLLSALASIHAAGYIHGDLSPHNILLQQDDQPLLLDLGSAMPLAGPPTTEPRQATPSFSPPEAWNGQPMGAYSDIHALAAVAYGLMSGHYPDSQSEHPPERPAYDAPSGFIDAILSALQPDPAQRPQSIAEFSTALGLNTPTGSSTTAGNAGPATKGSYPQSELPATETLPRPPGIQAHPPVSASEFGASTWQASPPATRERATPPPVRPRSRLLPLLLLLTLLAAAGWWGPDLYRSHLKMNWRVAADGSADASSIAEALDTAPDNARITISAGVYPESLLIKRPVTLIGEGQVNIRPPAGPCLRFLAEHGSVQNLDLASAAPQADKTAGSEPPTPCVELIGGSPVLENNRIHSSDGPALMLSAGSQATVGLNTISASRSAGIVIDDASGGTIASNQIHDTGRSAIIVRGGAAPALHCNQIDSPAQAGLLIEDGSHPAIETNRIQNSGSSGIEVRAGARPLIQHNLIEMSGQTGIYVHSGAAPTLNDNQILASGFSGVIAGNGSQAKLLANSISASGEHGILLLPGSAITLTDNRITDNDGNGLVIAAGAQLRGTGNQINGNQRPQTIDGRGR